MLSEYRYVGRYPPEILVLMIDAGLTILYFLNPYRVKKIDSFTILLPEILVKSLFYYTREDLATIYNDVAQLNEIY